MPRYLEIPEDHPYRVFRVFAEVVWHHIGLPPLTPVQREICDWLQSGPKRLQVQAFRGVGKSYLTSAYVLWLLLLNPNEKILVISASKERADQFVLFVRRLISEMDVLRHLEPDRNRNDRDSAVSFDVGAGTPAHSPSVRAVGITGQLAGSRASTIILDDVEIPANSATPAQRDKLSESVKEVDAILLPEDKKLNVNPKVRVLGTPQSMQSVYTQMRERDYVPRIWPIQVPDEDTIVGYAGCLAPSVIKLIDQGFDPGTPTEPTRFPLEDIAERRLSYGSLGFALQFQLSTALSDAEKYPLKLRDALFASFPVDRAREVYVHSNHPQYRMTHLDNVGMPGDGFYSPADTIGEWIPFESTTVAVDPSGRGKDETAVCSGSVLGGQVFVHRVFGTLDGFSEETLTAIALEAKRVKAHRVAIEANFGGGMFANLLRPVLRQIYPCEILEIQHSAMKERRIIATLQPVLESHRLIFHDAIPKADRVPHMEDSDQRVQDRQLFRQLTHITDERGCLGQDDRLDSLSLLVEAFADMLSVDARQSKRDRQEDSEDRRESPVSFSSEDPDNWTSYANPFSQQYQ